MVFNLQSSLLHSFTYVSLDVIYCFSVFVFYSNHYSILLSASVLECVPENMGTKGRCYRFL